MKQPGVRSQPPVGLQNVGNTCFINSLLQCLLATQPLVAYFRSDEHEFNCKKPSPSAWCLLCEMQKLTQMVSDTSLFTEFCRVPGLFMVQAVHRTRERLACCPLEHLDLKYTQFAQACMCVSCQWAYVFGKNRDVR